MFLIHEASDALEILNENTAKGKNVYIEGNFLMTNRVNRNGRNYPRKVMEESVQKYLDEYVNQRRATGELNHPEYPFQDIKKAAIMIESLSWQGDNVVGKARVLDSPDGQQIKVLLDSNFNLGVSSRGLGEWKDERDTSKTITRFLLNAIDAVDMPSGQVCYVNSLTESVTQWKEVNGLWLKEQTIAQPQFNSERFMEAMQEMTKQFLTK